MYTDNYFKSDFDFTNLDQLKPQLQIYSVETDLKLHLNCNQNFLIKKKSRNGDN